MTPPAWGPAGSPCADDSGREPALPVVCARTYGGDPTHRVPRCELAEAFDRPIDDLLRDPRLCEAS